MKKVLLAFMVLMVLGIGTSFPASAEETDAAGALVGGWSVTEDYGNQEIYTTLWNIQQLVGPFDLVQALAGGYQRTGIGIELGNKGIVEYRCFGPVCKVGGYTFTGTIAGSTFSGKVVFRRQDIGYVHEGTFTATKMSESSEESEPESEGDPNPH
jgi:hypothetical protein